LASGSFQRITGRLIGVKQSTASSSIKRTAKALAPLSHYFIKLPTVEEMRAQSNQFFERFHIPNTPLGVDGAFVALGGKPCQNQLPEGLYPQDFFCRKQFYAINCLVTGDGNFLIRNLVVKWSGSTHDARIWSSSPIKSFIERYDGQFCVAADSAFPISTTLIKPYPRPTCPRKKKFNKCLSGLRTVATENIIGMWKNRCPGIHT
jgi:DDE superfamily endonuclease